MVKKGRTILKKMTAVEPVIKKSEKKSKKMKKMLYISNLMG